MSARSVVGKNSCTGIVYIAAFPFLVGHPEILNHMGLAGIKTLEQFPVKKRFLCERTRMLIFLAFFDELFLGIFGLCILLKMIDH